MALTTENKRKNEKNKGSLTEDYIPDIINHGVYFKLKLLKTLTKRSQIVYNVINVKICTVHVYTKKYIRVLCVVCSVKNINLYSI